MKERTKEIEKSVEAGEDYLKRVFSGNIILFYAFDVGDDIDLGEIRKKGLLPVRSVTLSPYFKNYHIPLSFQLPPDIAKKKGAESMCIASKAHHFGVLSFTYRIPFEGTFEELEPKLVALDEEYEQISERDAKRVYETILRAIRKPKFFHLKNYYFMVHVNPPKDRIAPEVIREKYGSTIATLLRLETEKLSAYQREDVLESATGYYGSDLVIIDSQGAFIYDEEYFEALEFFELGNIQKLELQYFDRLLFEKLSFYYRQGDLKIPLRAYIPLFGRWLDLPVSRLAKLRVDISVITERLESSIDMAGEAYYTKLYAMLVEKLSLQEWRESISKKLSIIQDIYSFYQDHLDAVHEEILTLVIIILIAIEIIR